VLVGSTLAEEDRESRPVGTFRCQMLMMPPSIPAARDSSIHPHAAAIETVVSGQVTRVVGPIYVAALASLSALIGAAAGLFWTPPIAAIISVSGLLLLFGGAVGLVANDWWIPIAMPLIGLALSPLVASMMRSSIEGSARRRLQQEMYFLTGLSTTMLERLAAGETVLRVDGETTEMTVMFADLSGFRGLSTEVSSEVFITHSRRSLAYMVQEIEAKGGWVNQFLGDCVMAIWGAPLHDPFMLFMQSKRRWPPVAASERRGRPLRALTLVL
jgi:adenylate cyclase